MNSPQRKFQRHRATAWRVLEGQAFIVTLEQPALHRLNPVGTRIWELICAGRTAGEITVALAAEFDVDDATAEADTAEFIGRLLEMEIIAPVETQ